MTDIASIYTFRPWRETVHGAKSSMWSLSSPSPEEVVYQIEHGDFLGLAKGARPHVNTIVFSTLYAAGSGGTLETMNTKVQAYCKAWLGWISILSKSGWAHWCALALMLSSGLLDSECKTVPSAGITGNLILSPKLKCPVSSKAINSERQLPVEFATFNVSGNKSTHQDASKSERRTKPSEQEAVQAFLDNTNHPDVPLRCTIQNHATMASDRILNIADSWTPRHRCHIPQPLPRETVLVRQILTERRIVTGP
ncbi:hypothetical protein AJ80_09565 [Polytolypa hystricis UAMH7299]|uniref:Uncharacterized protein n=1 Tax=Polytolypa hystricis (strain UAMH7299) TaxID=1447883 RepID=A0A2B7WNZ7_POLH7|nr:hypothetical protein AJ80_09565 [Polytolypa hystricis UAMH7299]